MNAGAKLGVYGLVLVTALGGGAALGGAAGPIDVDDAPAHDQHDDSPTAPPGNDDTTGVGGLSVADAGYRLVTEDRLAEPGEFAFTIEDADGDVVTDFDVEHDKQLHLVIASRDLDDYAHLHPEVDGDGRWSIELPDLPAGAYRAFADFRPTGGDPLTLGIDLTNPGPVESPAVLTPTTTDTIDGYQVTIDGDPRPGTSSTVTVWVTKDGKAVTTDPYLGARGHLVALRDGDLAYLHVHPLDDQTDGAVPFAVEIPTSGTYVLFFDFAHDGAVHTARFVVDTERPKTEQPKTGQPTTDQPTSDHGGDADHAHD